MGMGVLIQVFQAAMNDQGYWAGVVTGMIAEAIMNMYLRQKR